MMKHLKLFEDIKPLPEGITFEYTDSSDGEDTIAQLILFNERAIGFVRYSNFDRYTKEIYEKGIYSVVVAFINDNDFFRKGIYTNALVDFVRKYNCMLISNKEGRNKKSEAVWDKMINNQPHDMLITFDGEKYIMKKE